MVYLYISIYSRGQLGHGELTVDKVTKPKSVDTLEGIKVTSVVCGGWHSTAVTGNCLFSTGTVNPRVGIFLSPLKTNDGFYLHT